MDLRSAFGFHTTPFTREIKTDQLFVLPMLQQALDGTLRAVDRRMSAAVIAPAGTGKTTAARALKDRLPEARYRVRYVKGVSLSKRDTCREIARACGIDPMGSFPAIVCKLQERFERTLDDDGLRPVLILDDAHDLRPDVLAMFRTLTNFAMDSRLVLSIVLVGQSPLAALLARDDQEAIARRIAHYASLRPLSRDETQDYLAHRTSIAGARQHPFDAAATDALFEMSRGNLRAIDGLALESLDLAAAAKLQVVSAQHVAAARRALWPS